MSDSFVPTSTPPKNPILAKSRARAATPAAEPSAVYEPFDKPVFEVPAEEQQPIEDIGLPPTDLMAPTDTSEGLYTEATYDEIEAGKKAGEVFSKRRKAELDYGKNFAARRKSIVNG